MKLILILALMYAVIEEFMLGLSSGFKEMWSYWSCYISVCIKDFKRQWRKY
jgi:multidrug transporter EmrE-like cation transporter